MKRERRGFSRVVAGFSSYNGKFRLPLLLAQGSPIFHSSCEGELGIALESLQEKRDLIQACVQDLMFLSRGDRDPWFATRLTRGVRLRLEGKQKTPFSSRIATGMSWGPLSDQNGVKPTVEFAERTQDCSPGQARKEGHHIKKTRVSRGFSRAAAPVCGFSRGTTGSSGRLSSGVREVSSPCA